MTEVERNRERQRRWRERQKARIDLLEERSLALIDAERRIRDLEARLDACRCRPLLINPK